MARFVCIRWNGIRARRPAWWRPYGWSRAVSPKRAACRRSWREPVCPWSGLTIWARSIQLAALRGVYPMEAPDLHAAPEAPVTRAEAAAALTAYFGKRMNAREAQAHALREGWM